jgi:hypothetical protein
MARLKKKRSNKKPKRWSVRLHGEKPPPKVRPPRAKYDNETLEQIAALPPYILFKAEYLYDSWCENGPEGARYQVSSSGWMEQLVFFDWFSTLFVPRVEQLEGLKPVQFS